MLERLNSSSAYRQLFGALFPSVTAGEPIDFIMFARAIAEFEFTLTFANAPIDRFARGDTKAMTVPQKKGAIVFFGKGRMCPVSRGGWAIQRHVQRFPKSCAPAFLEVAPFFGMDTGKT